MSNLALVKSENFHGVKCDFWQDKENGTFFMTIDQLAAAIGYASKSGIENILMRNEYLKTDEFSTTHKLKVVEGKRAVSRDRIIFTEDGIYEVSMLAGSDRAREFRAKVRKVLKALRTGAIKVFKQIDPAIIEARAKNAQARLLNANRNAAEFILKNAVGLSAVPAELVKINAIEMIIGKGSLPRPKIEKLYTADEIGKEAGLSENMIGRLANKHGLKTEQYGMLVLDQARNNHKQVHSFRYNEDGRKELLRLAAGLKKE